ncbi:hypothetical protein HPP92_004845 [Vanilla planifolia]|uniref:Retrotransposon gag domain-containing protein n=1 Tax=Vanilla planifolia TaxID=51239 RepID=A0A835RKL0_VANPL|nr:hypothetical protein HPP92_004845 [Vanilla planifolia]
MDATHFASLMHHFQILIFEPWDPSPPCFQFTVFVPGFSMKLSSPELSNSASTLRSTQRRRRRRRLRIRPPSSVSAVSNPSYSQTHDSAEDNGTPIDYYSDVPELSIKSSFSTTAAVESPPTYINVAPLPVFHGFSDECPIAHLSRFERICRANNAFVLDMADRIFPVTLLDEASLWYELAVEPHPSMSWEQIKSTFLHAFRRPESTDIARAELISLRQRDGESVTSYHLRMQGILKRWPEHRLPGSLLKGLFVDGLREEFHDWVLPRRPETLEEAVRCAMDWEAAQVARAVRRREVGALALEVEARCGFCEGKHAEAECEVRRRMREEWLAKVRDEGRKSGRESKKEFEGVEQRLGSGRRSQCLCWKHQCWKKYERSSSAVTETAFVPSAATVATTSAAAPVPSVPNAE